MNYFLLIVVLFCNYNILNKIMIALTASLAKEDYEISIVVEIVVSCILIPFLVY